MKRIFFEANEHDFLWMDIDAEGKITDCGPNKIEQLIGTTMAYHNTAFVGGSAGIQWEPTFEDLLPRVIRLKIEKIELSGTKRIYFEDNGQDFLWWEIDPDGVVVGCGPFQSSIWVGSTVINHSRLRVDGPVYFVSNQGQKLTLIHKIRKIEENEQL